MDGAAALAKDGCVAFHFRVVVGLIESPYVGEDEARQIAVRCLLDDAAPEFSDKPTELRTLEREVLQEQIDRLMVVEEPQAGATRDLRTDRHLSDGAWSDDEEQDRVARPRQRDSATELG